MVQTVSTYNCYVADDVCRDPDHWKVFSTRRVAESEHCIAARKERRFGLFREWVKRGLLLLKKQGTLWLVASYCSEIVFKICRTLRSVKPSQRWDTEWIPY
jgi:hypothetical protein